MANIFDELRNLTDSFFDGLKRNTEKRMLAKAQKEEVPSPIIEKLNKLEHEKEYLDAVIERYSDDFVNYSDERKKEIKDIISKYEKTNWDNELDNEDEV